MSDAALSVLVLAWDETAPTLRTVIAAAPAVGSLLVLLPPQPPAPPVAAPTSLPAAPVATVPATVAEDPAPAETLASTEPAAVPSTANPGLGASTVIPSIPPRVVAPAEASRMAPSLPSAASPVQPTLPTVPLPASVPAVRLLRLADNPLVLLEHISRFQTPAAPYLGATPPASAQVGTAAPVSLPALTPATQTELSPPETAPTFDPVVTLAEPAAPLGPAESVELLGAPGEQPLVAAEAASSLEATTSTEAIAPGSPELVADENVPALADAAFRAEEILDPDPMQELQAAPLSQPAATLADSPILRDALPVAYGPFGLRIPERLPVLNDPTPPPTRRPEPDEEESLPNEPAPVAAPYSAPDLNMQVIRYARQAVQAALAEGPFGTIYAPAWPTWLAALELRQRSGRPLVLHLTTLSAGRQSADTAAGWAAEIQRQALRQADLILVETYSLARRLRRELGLATSAVRVVPAGDTAAIARALRRARRV